MLKALKLFGHQIYLMNMRLSNKINNELHYFLSKFLKLLLAIN